MECEKFTTQVDLLFHSISARMTSILREFYEPYSLTAPQAMILLALHQKGPEKISNMARCLGMTNSNLSVICRRLEKSGFVIRKRDEFDQRVVYLYLSEHSKTLLKDLNQRLEEDYLQSLGQASPEDQKIILAGLKRLEELLACEK